MWYFTYWALNIIIKLLCVLAGRPAVDIWWWRFWGWGVLCMVNVDSSWWQWHLNGSRLSSNALLWYVQRDKDGSLNKYTNTNLSVIKERDIWIPETCHNTWKINFPHPHSWSLYQTGHPCVHIWRYSPFRALASLIRRLHLSLFSALLLHPLIPNSCNASHWTISAHLFLGLPTGLVV